MSASRANQSFPLYVPSAASRTAPPRPDHREQPSRVAAQNASARVEAIAAPEPGYVQVSRQDYEELLARRETRDRSLAPRHVTTTVPALLAGAEVEGLARRRAFCLFEACRVAKGLLLNLPVENKPYTRQDLFYLTVSSGYSCLVVSPDFFDIVHKEPCDAQPCMVLTVDESYTHVISALGTNAFPWGTCKNRSLAPYVDYELRGTHPRLSNLELDPRRDYPWDLSAEASDVMLRRFNVAVTDPNQPYETQAVPNFGVEVGLVPQPTSNSLGPFPRYCVPRALLPYVGHFPGAAMLNACTTDRPFNYVDLYHFAVGLFRDTGSVVLLSFMEDQHFDAQGSFPATTVLHGFYRIADKPDLCPSSQEEDSFMALIFHCSSYSHVNRCSSLLLSGDLDAIPPVPIATLHHLCLASTRARPRARSADARPPPPAAPAKQQVRKDNGMVTNARQQRGSAVASLRPSAAPYVPQAQREADYDRELAQLFNENTAQDSRLSNLESKIAALLNTAPLPPPSRPSQANTRGTRGARRKDISFNMVTADENTGRLRQSPASMPAPRNLGDANRRLARAANHESALLAKLHQSLRNLRVGSGGFCLSAVLSPSLEDAHIASLKQLGPAPTLAEVDWWCRSLGFSMHLMQLPLHEHSKVITLGSNTPCRCFVVLCENRPDGELHAIKSYDRVVAHATAPNFCLPRLLKSVGRTIPDGIYNGDMIVALADHGLPLFFVNYDQSQWFGDRDALYTVRYETDASGNATHAASISPGCNPELAGIFTEFQGDIQLAGSDQPSEDLDGLMATVLEDIPVHHAHLDPAQVERLLDVVASALDTFGQNPITLPDAADAASQIVPHKTESRTTATPAGVSAVHFGFGGVMFYGPRMFTTANRMPAPARLNFCDLISSSNDRLTPRPNDLNNISNNLLGITPNANWPTGVAVNLPVSTAVNVVGDGPGNRSIVLVTPAAVLSRTNGVPVTTTVDPSLTFGSKGNVGIAITNSADVVRLRLQGSIPAGDYRLDVQGIIDTGLSVPLSTTTNVPAATTALEITASFGINVRTMLGLQLHTNAVGAYITALSWGLALGPSASDFTNWANMPFCSVWRCIEPDAFTTMANNSTGLRTLSTAIYMTSVGPELTTAGTYVMAPMPDGSLPLDCGFHGSVESLSQTQIYRSGKLVDGAYAAMPGLITANQRLLEPADSIGTRATGLCLIYSVPPGATGTSLLIRSAVIAEFAATTQLNLAHPECDPEVVEAYSALMARQYDGYAGRVFMSENPRHRKKIDAFLRSARTAVKGAARMYIDNYAPPTVRAAYDAGRHIRNRYFRPQAMPRDYDGY